MKFLYYKDFLGSLNRLSGKGFNYSSPYNRALNPYLLAGQNCDFDEAFAGLKVTDHGEKRIEHAVKFDLGRACRLVIIKNNNMCNFLFAGIHSDVDKWLDRHRGLKTVIGKDSGVIGVLQRTKSGNDDQIPHVSQNPAEFNLCEKLEVNDQNFLFRDINKPSILGAIYNLNSMDTDDTIWKCLEEIEDEQKAHDLWGILIRLRDPIKNSTSIKKIIGDMRGEYIGFEEASKDQIDISEGGSEVTVIDLGNSDNDTTRRILQSKNFRDWMLTMHPKQKVYAEKDFNGPVQLRGVSGSGKTAVVINRAIRLALKYPDEKVLIITLNKALAKMIEDLVNSASDELKNLTVTSLWHFCKDQLAIFDPKHSRHYEEETWLSKKNHGGEHIDDIWEEYYYQENNNYDSDVMLPVHQSLLQNNIYSADYIREEFDFIRSALPYEKRLNEYIKLPREGRSFALQENFRKMILDGLSGWENKMKAVGTIDYLGLTSRVHQFIDQIQPTYRSILIDEMQDFGTLELEIIRKLVKEDENDIFLAGDTVQRVLTKKHDHNAAGINIHKRTFELYQNYRNTKEILVAANNILEENLTSIEYEKTDLEILSPKYAESSSYLPHIKEADSLSEELTYALQYLQQSLTDNENEDDEVQIACIAIAGYHLSELKDLGKELRIQLLDATIQLENKKIFLSDLEQTKGFEFDHMIIVNCCHNILPNPSLPPEEAFRDLSRFYVAMTRARKNLIISYNRKLSSFVEKSLEHFIDDPVKWGDWFELKDKPRIKGFNDAGRSERFLQPKLKRYSENEDYGSLTGKQLLLTRRAVGMSKARQNKLLKYITGARKKSQTSRDNTWKNLNELFVDQQVMINAVLAEGIAVENVVKEVDYFRELFEIHRHFKQIKKEKFWAEETNEELEAEPHHKNGTTVTDTRNNWEVILDNTGICMHCGHPSIPGDYVCLQCNPG